MDAAELKPARTLFFVAVVAISAAAIVTASHEFSKDRIAANERAALLASLHSVIDLPVGEASLNPVQMQVTDPEHLGSNDPIDVFVVVDDGKALAVIFATVAPHGYNAPIRLLVGVSAEGRITGVRAVSHRETPGLGDAIEIAKSDWIRQFDGKSLGDPALELWAVDKDEGSFDSLTGATVTPRAVVAAVKNTLLYFEMHERELIDEALKTSETSAGGADD
jgi:Na+-translocating ferredoxin:NAD+ oxidoreductase subunit G